MAGEEEERLTEQVIGQGVRASELRSGRAVERQYDYGCKTRVCCQALRLRMWPGNI